MREIEAVIFDMDGVLFDTERMYLNAWKLLGDKYGFADAEQSAIECIGLSFADSSELLKKKYGEHFKLSEYQEEIHHMVPEKMFRDGMPLKPGAKEILQYLSDIGYPLGLASSTITYRVQQFLEKAELKQYFDIIVGGDMIEHSKPDPQIYLLACEKLGYKPEDTVAVEDSRNGILSAYNAGMMTFMVPDIVQPNEEVLKMVSKKFDSLFGVKEYFEERT